MTYLWYKHKYLKAVLKLESFYGALSQYDSSDKKLYCHSAYLPPFKVYFKTNEGEQ